MKKTTTRPRRTKDRHLSASAEPRLEQAPPVEPERVVHVDLDVLALRVLRGMAEDAVRFERRLLARARVEVAVEVGELQREPERMDGRRPRDREGPVAERKRLSGAELEPDRGRHHARGVRDLQPDHLPVRIVRLVSVELESIVDAELPVDGRRADLERGHRERQVGARDDLAGLALSRGRHVDPGHPSVDFGEEHLRAFDRDARLGLVDRGVGVLRRL
jgi:hypothetical protein